MLNNIIRNIETKNIEKDLQTAFTQARKSNNPQARQFWAQIPETTNEKDIIIKLSEYVIHRLNK